MTRAEKDAGKAEKSVKDLSPKADQVKGGRKAGEQQQEGGGSIKKLV